MKLTNCQLGTEDDRSALLVDGNFSGTLTVEGCNFSMGEEVRGIYLTGGTGDVIITSTSLAPASNSLLPTIHQACM